MGLTDKRRRELRPGISVLGRIVRDHARAQEARAERKANRYQTPPEASRAKRLQADSSLAGSPANRQEESTFHVERLPETYDRVAVQKALDGVAAQVAAPAAPAGPVDGALLAPGSVPASALNGRELGRGLVALPSAEETIQLELVQSDTMDRFIRSAAGVSGPGRIWTATASPSSTARVGAGPARYRIVRPDMRFGVLSMRLVTSAVLTATPLPGIQITYGVVIARIPHYLGRPPSRIRAIESVGGPPISLAFRFADGGKAAAFPVSRVLYWPRAQAEYETQGLYPSFVTFGSDAVLAPVATDWRDSRGIAAQLITGRDANEVMQQLCTRQALGKIISFDGKPPTATVPEFYTAEAPSPPNCLRWVTTGGVTETYEHIQSGVDLTLEPRIVQGLPFDYDDCAALVPTETHFSVVVQLGFERLRSQLTAPASWGTPETWHQNGLKTLGASTGRLRSWAVDITID